jgi:hypothetical protein
MNNSARKDEIAKRLAELLAIRVGDEFCDDCGGSLLAASSSDFGVLEPCQDCEPRPPLLVHVERDFIDRVAKFLTASEERTPIGEGWQQRIAAMDPWVNRNGPHDVVCYFCLATRSVNSPDSQQHEPDCLWQNAKDATPPASSVLKDEGAEP